jgi:DNA-binding beta-propeller fold protein YncE
MTESLPTGCQTDWQSVPRTNSNGSLLWLLLAAAILVAGGLALARQNGTAAGDAPKSDDKRDPVEAKAPAAAGNAKNGKLPEQPFPKRFKAPSLDGGTEWLNTSGPITLKDVRGKIVLLDFWTYCCINCMHVLPDLKRLEKKYPKELVVIGVHSAKFDNEKDSENIRKAILRHDIEHPVINDSKMSVWRKFFVRAWPSLVVIDPEGNYCGYVSGEGNRELLDIVIKKLIAYHKAKGTLDETPIRFDLERRKAKPTPLRFPGKVAVDEASGRLFVSDTGHNRIVVASLDGKLLDVIGSGEIGAKDGPYAAASFDHPQGTALVGGTLYVADTENHLLRAVDLKKKTVSTLAGTGRQARARPTGGKLRDVSLNSPWAIAHVKGTLYVCMAGPHQLWSHKLGSGRIDLFSGTGREDVANGGHRECAYAQPSGISTDGKVLYVADSEGSAIRRAEIGPKGNVDTLAGTSDLPLGRSLFEFGDRDGSGGDARLQHPLDVAWHDGKLYVADTYNHKIRIIEPAKKSKVTTWLGDGKRGANVKPPRFAEPGGVAVAPKRGKLYIADTNNNRICVADLKTGAVDVLEIPGLKPPKKPTGNAIADVAVGAVTALKPQSIKSGGKLTLAFFVKLPEGYKLNANFPHRYRLATADTQAFLDKQHLRGKPRVSADGKSLLAKLPLAKAGGSATFQLSLTFGYCRDGKGGLCKLRTVRWKLPLKIDDKQGRTRLTLNVDAEGAQQ